MRTGADYREALRDGRKVWVMGEGPVDDVTVHPATRAMVDEYAAWYDRHFDREWHDIVLTPPDARGARTPWSFVVPTSPAELRAMGKCFSATTFLSAGNITHTPAYGHLIALGILDAVQQRNVSREQIGYATEYRALIARTGRFLTFSAGAATIGARLRDDPSERLALRAVRENDAGIILRGKVGMHTSPVYAEDVYIGSHSGVDHGGHRATFIVPVNAPGVTVLCRKPSSRHSNPFIAPLSSRYDELDSQMWLDDVFVPWERVFLMDLSPEPMASWLFWHQLYCWLSKAEFTLGLALACTDAMGLAEHEPTIEYLVDIIADVHGADLPDRGRARSRGHARGLLHPGTDPCRRGQLGDAEGAPAHHGNVAHPSRVVARRRSLRQGPRGSRGRGRAGGVVWRRRVHGAPALGLAADGRGSRRLGPGRPRVHVRATRQRRAP